MNPDENPQPVTPPTPPESTPDVPPAQPVPPVTPTPTPPQPTVPDPAPAPQPTVAAPAQPVAPVYTAPAAGAKSGSSLGLILGLIGGAAVVLLIVLIAGWLLFWSPQARSKHVSSAFMNAMMTGDIAKAAQLSSDGNSSDTKAFLQTASDKTKGTATAQQSVFQSNTRYTLYGLSNSDKKYARVTVDKENGKWLVNSYVYSASALALVPSTSKVTASNDQSTNTPTSTPADTAGCLTASDFSFFSNLNQGTPDPNANGTYSDFYQLLFNPDAATYAADAIPDPTTVFNDFKNFYAQDANKKYIIELEASVNSASSDDQLANARNNKVLSDLENISGIPASKISIQPNTNDTENNSGDSFNRQVQITLRSADSCATD